MLGLKEIKGWYSQLQDDCDDPWVQVLAIPAIAVWSTSSVVIGLGVWWWSIPITSGIRWVLIGGAVSLVMLGLKQWVKLVSTFVHLTKSWKERITLGLAVYCVYSLGGSLSSLQDAKQFIENVDKTTTGLELDITIPHHVGVCCNDM